jgi:hypothetical protein
MSSGAPQVTSGDVSAPYGPVADAVRARRAVWDAELKTVEAARVPAPPPEPAKAAAAAQSAAEERRRLQRLTQELERMRAAALAADKLRAPTYDSDPLELVDEVWAEVFSPQGPVFPK